MPSDKKPADDLDYDAPRALIRRLMAEHRLDMKALSLRIGRADTYIRDYLERGRPVKLGEDSREALAREFPGYSPDDFKAKPRQNQSVNGSVTSRPLSSATAQPAEEGSDKMSLYDRLFADVFARLRILEDKLQNAPDRETPKRPPQPRGKR